MRFILALYLLVCSLDLKAQENFHGYYVTLNNDTIYTNYKFKSIPVFSFRNYDLSEYLEIVNQSKETVKLEPTAIKSFFIKGNTEQAYFISLPRRNGKQKFFRVIALSPQFNIYGFFVPVRYGSVTEFALQKNDSSYLYIGPDDGNQKTKKRLKDFFAHQDNILLAIKDLFTKPGFVQADMETFIKRIFHNYQR